MIEYSKSQKSECFEYSFKNKVPIFQRDLNASGAKILLTDTYDNIFNNIKKGKNNYYEYWSAQMPVKIYFDYDEKIEIQDPNDLKKRIKVIDQENNYKTNLLNIINVVRELIPTIKGTYILKSVPGHIKRSFHIIFDGVHFANRSTLKRFIEEQIKPHPKLKEIFDKKIFDMKVYGDLCFRTLLSTKFGQNRPLYLIDTESFLSDLQENIIPIEDTTLYHFLKCSISHIEPESILYNYRSEKKKNTSKKIHLMNDEDIYSDREVVRKYLDILDGDRYTDYNKWINIGFILYSINPEYIDLWHYFSAKYEHYNENECNKKWNTFGSSEYIYTINNLIYLAKVDNPDDCDELSLEIPNHDIRYLRPIDNVLSKLIHRLYGENFVCSDPKKDEWYYFNGIRWKKENKSFNLRKKIINEVFSKIEIYRKQLIKEGASDDIIKNYHNILCKLGSGIKLNCLDIEFYNENFYKIIDQNKDIIGFENGIFDLITMEFRNGVSSDYVSLSTGYDYQHFSEDDPFYKELIYLIEQIIPNYETREFTLKSLASCLDGHTRDENFYIWSGKNASGGNGKSTITELLAKALGDYAVDSPVSLITSKRESANNANSALFSIINKRVVIMQEPGANELIQGDILKSLVGGDRISTRELQSTQISFKPNAKFVLCCNRLPQLSETDGGTQRRIKITEFISRFVDNPNNQEYQYEFKIDKNLKSKLEQYKPVFMCLLLKYYKKYKEEGLLPPSAVLQVTKRYENSNNYMKTFIEDNIVKGHKSDYITVDEIKTIYKSDVLLRNNFPKVTLFLQQLENALCKEFILDSRRKLRKIDGFKLRKDEDIKDSESDDIDNE